VADRKPPRLAAGELDTLLTLLQFQRESLVRKVEGVTDEAAAWSPVGSGTTLRWLVEHLARAETSWVEQRFAGHPPSEAGEPLTLDEAVARYREVWARTDAIARGSSLDARCVAEDATAPVSLRWVLAHLLEETARHAGHADILRELLDGQVGR
jgi:hypothetical protein